MNNCIDKQENPDQELDNLKDWKEKQIKFEARRGRKGRFQRAAEHTRLSGVDFIFTHFGLSDQYKKEDKWKILKRVMIMARTQIPPRKISRVDFDKWWFDPIIDKDRPAYDDMPVKQVAYRQTAGADLQNLGIGSVSRKAENLFKIDTFETSGLTSHIEKLEKIAKIHSITYSKKTGISLWVKLK